MKAFSSSILADTSYSSPEVLKESYTSFKDIKDSREPMFIRLLQFDEAAAIADMNSTRDFYIGLLKMCNDNKNPKFDSAYQAIFNKFDAVYTAAKALNTEALHSDRPEECPPNDMFIRLNNLSSVINTTIPIICDKVSTPTPVYSEAYYGVLREFCKNGIEHIKGGSFNTWDYEPHIVEDICAFVSEASGIQRATSIDEFITNYDAAIKYEPSDIAIANVKDAIYRACVKIRDSKGYIRIDDFDGYALLCTLIDTMKINSDNLDINKVRSVVNTICDAIATYAILDAKMKDIIDKHCKYIKDFNTKNVMKFIGTAIGNNDISVRESMEIFGDEITSKSLFDDLDPEDFNRTEFMDLSLVAEHVMKMDKIHGRKYAIALEASLLAQGKYDELYKVNEALGQSIKQGVGKLIEAIKKIIAKFTETLMGNFASEKKYLTKYKNAILNNKIDPNTKITFNGNVIEGMARLDQQFKIPTTSYNDLMKKPEQFESIETFFDKHRSDFGIGGDFKPTGDGSLADQLKYYWGYKQDNYSKDVIFKDLNILNIYNWLLKTEKEAGDLRRESKNLDRTYKNYEASAKQYAGDRQPVQASYYSAIYDKIITEGDAPTITPVQNPKPAVQPAANDKQQNSQNQNDENKTNTKLTRGDTDKEVQNTKDDESKIVKNMEIYTKTCQAVIGARATGYEYVHKQLMYIIRFIVKSQFGASADIQYNQPQEQAPAQK